MGKLSIQRYHNGRVIAISGFMGAEQCRALINQAEEIGFEEAKVTIDGQEQLFKGVRNNYRAMLDDARIAQELFGPSQIFLPEYIDDWRLDGLNTLFRFYKYEPGQRFKKHQDGRKRFGDNIESRYTWMVYLNDDFQGGALAFDNGDTLQPEQGMLVVFPHEVKHESVQIAAGEKYVLRTDVLYKQLPPLTEDDVAGPASYNYNEVFCQLVSKVFDSFFFDMGYELVQNEREAFSATYKYKHYGHNIGVVFTYSGFPDGPAYYEIRVKLPTRFPHLEWLCQKLNPNYQANQDQFITMVKNDYRQLMDSEFEARLQRHLWEMKLLCLDVLQGAPVPD